MNYEVLYFAKPPWLIDETQEARDERVCSGRAADAAECYPGDYAGRVSAVKPAGYAWRSGDLADPCRRLVTLELDEDGRQGAASKTLKLAGDRLVPVTFDDRWGAVAVKLRERHPDPEAWEADETAAREAAEAANLEAMRAHDVSMREWRALRETFASDVIAAGKGKGPAPAIPEQPKPPRLAVVPVSSFDVAAAELADTLPPTTCHTGAGLYCVGSYAETQRTSGFGGEAITAVAHGGGLWVAAGSAGLLATSPDGITWTHRDVGFGGEDVFGVAYAGGLWVAVGQLGLLATSPDGITWTLRTSQFGASNICSVAHDGSGLWVIVGTSGKLATSPDGTTWTLRTSSFGVTAIFAVAHDGSALWCAVGASGKIATSPDGTTWTQRTAYFGADGINAVAHNGTGLWVAVGSAKIATSLDGTTWTMRTSSFGATDIYGVNFDATSRWVAVGDTGKVAESWDGVTWVQESPGFGTALIACVADDGAGVLVIGAFAGKLATAVAPPFSIVQGACDQLLTDQGATLFSAIQELRLYGGTYTENVVLSLTLVTNFENFLWVRAATGETPVINGTTADCWQVWPDGHSRFEGITFSTGGTGRGLACNTIQRGKPLEVRRCTFNTANGVYQNHSQYGTFIIDDCTFTLTNSSEP